MGENKKVTIMVLKVDLQCEKCYRKVKKVLCKFPQIRDQKYDEKNHQVIIKVVCCNPEKIRDKLCCKGGCVIKSIDIIEPETMKPPPPPEKVKPPPPPEKVKPPPPPEKVKPPPPPEKVKPPPPPEKVKPPPVTCPCPPVTCPCPCPHVTCPCPCPPVTCRCPPVTCRCPPVTCRCPPVTCKSPRPPVTCPPLPPPVPFPPLPPPVPCPPPPVNTCCTECYEGRPGGPCETGYGYGVPDPYIQYDGYCGRPVYDSYGGWRSHNTSSYCVTRPDCFSEENPQACAIM